MAYSEDSELVFDAMGDATRRKVLELLRDGPRAVVDIARQMPVSRPAVSQHLRVLKEAGLVRDRRDGTRHLYSIDTRGLAEMRTFLEDHWDDALASFRAVAEDTSSGPDRQPTQRKEGRRP
jgi:DNA-binding transcriptional ArsR family regulator